MITGIVEYYYNQKSQTLQVSFRTQEDSDEYIREDEFEIDYIENSGFTIIENYNYESSDIPLSYEEDTDDLFLDDDFIEESEYNIDENELKSFLVEYYTENPKKMPKQNLF